MDNPNKAGPCQGLFPDSPLKHDHLPLRNKSAPSLITVSDDIPPPPEASTSENTLPPPSKKRGAPLKTLDACSVRRRIESISQYGYPPWVINQRTLSHVVEFHLQTPSKIVLQLHLDCSNMTSLVFYEFIPLRPENPPVGVFNFEQDLVQLLISLNEFSAKTRK